MKNKIIKELLKEVMHAYKNEEIPIGCVIVKNGAIVSKTHNTKNSTNNCLNHAEILAITKAEKKLKNWRLNNCSLYVTLKPCKMCYEVIKQCRIEEVYYLLDSNYKNDDHHQIVVEELNEFEAEKKEYLNLIQAFFKKKR